MKRSFEDWFNDKKPEEEPKAKEPEKFYDYDAELPAGVDFADEPGHYIYLCRGCDKWKPMEWELSEDSMDSHYCGGSPYCCPMPSVPPGRPVAQKPRPKPAPKPAPKSYATTAGAKPTHFQCIGCHNWHPVKDACLTSDGRMWCGRYGCVPDEEMYYQPQRATPDQPSALEQKQRAQREYDLLKNTVVCDGCNMRVPLDRCGHHPHSHRPYCGNNECYHKIIREMIKARDPHTYGPPRAG